MLSVLNGAESKVFVSVKKMLSKGDVGCLPVNAVIGLYPPIADDGELFNTALTAGIKLGHSSADNFNSVVIAVSTSLISLLTLSTCPFDQGA